MSLKGGNSAQFDSHAAVEKIPDSLVKAIDGNAGMRRKFERLVRQAQVNLCFIVTVALFKGLPTLGRHL
jgi:uncharacterized protein YdeI (YjbR/CyaY-like superfamily)